MGEKEKQYKLVADVPGQGKMDFTGSKKACGIRRKILSKFVKDITVEPCATENS